MTLKQYEAKEIAWLEDRVDMLKKHNRYWRMAARFAWLWATAATVIAAGEAFLIWGLFR